ncbi:timeless-domain-containing protein [Nadsonia fulvescens var. elongata DSM 6958]|uniref:Topoisomerase 1-associated factor 1 n=1 Tax=Nadsonia fulvescens var. elongata DSM 6958 TaxID=857566 RepID=A0A1E3PNY7_9ASCO|nr:timeless-domain-containing protein [Nadsonia fulvescens var. elongata DSM 6958]
MSGPSLGGLSKSTQGEKSKPKIGIEVGKEPEPTSVDPVLKGHITNLVSALGGPDQSLLHKPYKMGDEALNCLKDIKRWMVAYDQNLDRWDVARAISETSLVTYDLLEILAAWETQYESNDDNEEEEREENGDQANQNKNSQGKSTVDFAKHMDRIALACLELLVPLTMPLNSPGMMTKTNHYKHFLSLEKAKASYKRSILIHPSGVILKSVVRLCFPSLTKPKHERTSRDTGILRLALYFFRNILAIETSNSESGSNTNIHQDDISRNNTIAAFKNQDVLEFFIMLASGMPANFIEQDVSLMDCLYYLLRGIKAETIFTSESEALSKSHLELKGLLDLEKSSRNQQMRTASSRHNRFGTMLSIKLSESERLSVSSQRALTSNSKALEKLDETKQWRKPKSRRVEADPVWEPLTKVSNDTRKILYDFVPRFLQVSFNPLFIAVRKEIERDADRIIGHNKMQYLYLVSWFLEAELNRRNFQKISFTNPEGEFGFVAGALNQETFIIVMKLMRECHEAKDWPTVYTSMLCFKQILLVVHELSLSPVEMDQEIAENITERLFYEKYSLDVLAALPQTAGTKPLVYLDACIELTHIVLKMMERFSKQHPIWFVKAKKRNSKKNQQQKEGVKELDHSDYGESDNEAENIQAKQDVSERKFSFAVFESRFMHEETILSYKQYLQNFKELSPSQIMRAFKFFHRIFFKRDNHVILYKLDFMILLHEILSPEKGLSRSNPARKEVSSFMKNYMKKFIESVEKVPSLFMELLFSKTNDSVYYLEHGQDMVKHVKDPRAVAVFDFKHKEFDIERRFSIVVATLLDEDKRELVEWLLETVIKMVRSRKAWQVMAISREAQTGEGNSDLYLQPPAEILRCEDDNAKNNSINRDGKFRLLLLLCGFELSRPENPNTILPSIATLEQIETAEKYIKRYLFESVDFGNGKAAIDFIKRININPRIDSRRRHDSDNSDESVGEYDEGNGFIASNSEADNISNSEEDVDFNDGRFTTISAELRQKRLELAGAQPKIKGSSHPKKIKKSSRDRATRKPRKENEYEAQLRRKIELEKAKLSKIKSDMYIHDSDDESDIERDEAFFEAESLLRNRLMKENSSINDQVIEQQPMKEDVLNMVAKNLLAELDEDENVQNSIAGASKMTKRTKNALFMESDDSQNSDALESNKDSRVKLNSSQSSIKPKRPQPFGSDQDYSNDFDYRGNTRLAKRAKKIKISSSSPIKKVTRPTLSNNYDSDGDSDDPILDVYTTEVADVPYNIKLSSSSPIKKVRKPIPFDSEDEESDDLVDTATTKAAELLSAKIKLNSSSPIKKTLKPVPFDSDDEDSDSEDVDAMNTTTAKAAELLAAKIKLNSSSPIKKLSRSILFDSDNSDSDTGLV